MKFPLGVVVVLVVAGLCVIGPAGRLAADAVKAKRTYRLAQTERGAETVTTIEGTRDDVVFDITSKSGIGRLVVTPVAGEAGESAAGGEWSAIVTLRLHLRGLALIELDNGKQTITSESLRGPKPRATYVTPSGEAAKQQRKNEVSDEHALFLSVRRVSPKKQHAAQEDRDDKLANEYFEVRVPRAFLKDSPTSIRIRWIDFYRG